MEMLSLNWENIDLFCCHPSDATGVSVHLNAEERDSLAQMKSESRKREWLAVRMLCQQNINSRSIKYRASGKPYLEGAEIGFSISHTSSMAGIAVSDDKRHLALDIEEVSERVLRVKEKFLSERELVSVTAKEYIVEFATIIWCAKEVMYKILEDASVDFKTHYSVHDFDPSVTSEFEGLYSKDGEAIGIKMKFWQQNNTIIVAGFKNESF